MNDTTMILKRLRALGLTQTEIARRLGIPQGRLSRWESGDVPDSVKDGMRLLELVQLAEAGNLPPLAPSVPPTAPTSGAESDPPSPANPASTVTA